MAGASRVGGRRLPRRQRRPRPRAARVFKGWLGDRVELRGLQFGDQSWQANPSFPVGVQPVGAVKKGLNIDGALADDMRRGCALQVPPCHTDYAWEGMQGAIVEAQILARRGFDAFGWQDRAMLRAARFLRPPRRRLRRLVGEPGRRVAALADQPRLRHLVPRHQPRRARQDHGLDGLDLGLSVRAQPGSATSASVKPTSSPKVVSIRWRSIP